MARHPYDDLDEAQWDKDRLTGAGIYIASAFVAAGILWLLSMLPAPARPTPEVMAQFAQSTPEQRQWFRSQVSPKTGINCCSEADGTYVEEDIRADAEGNSHYWIRFRLETERGVVATDGWQQVPDEIVIKDPNRNGAPVVWWYYINGKLEFRCYAAGGGV